VMLEDVHLIGYFGFMIVNGAAGAYCIDKVGQSTWVRVGMVIPNSSVQKFLVSNMDDVILETSMGTIMCEMYYDHAPRTCKNFIELVCRSLI